MFSQFSKWVEKITGHPLAFSVAFFCIIVWLFFGKYYHFSDTWQLVINTVTTIITFLMVFLIQNSQNRETKSIQIKLDELIRAIKGAHNQLIDLENSKEKDIEKIHKRYVTLADKSVTKRKSPRKK